MPETIKQTRKVEVYYCVNILYRFKFFDGNNTLIFEVGYTERKTTEFSYKQATFYDLLIFVSEQIIVPKPKCLLMKAQLIKPFTPT